jgi:putative Mg2+ transporter-C (MgtC) family protein
METFLDELRLGLPDGQEVVRVLLRLGVAMMLGAVAGIQRERAGKAAGLRTHVLVAIGSALFVLVPVQLGLPASDIGRVIQGVAAGIGFIGGGAILKLSQQREIQGLTTAASIWMTAAVGVAAGVGRLGLAVIATLFLWATLSLLWRLEERLAGPEGPRQG